MTGHVTVPKTKLQPPRMRKELVPRPRLVGAVVQSMRQHPLTLISAGAGYGKTTLLSQALAQFGGSMRALWVSVDEEDDDLNRFGAALLAALEPLELDWGVDAQVLLKQLAQEVRQARPALNTIINALCSRDGQRLVIVLDDLHRVSDATVFAALDYLVERLPHHVGVVASSRAVPPLALAKLRGQGHLGEFRLEDLRFTETEARSLLAATTMRPEGDQAFNRIIGSCEGWPVGLGLLAQALDQDSPRPPAGQLGPEGEQALFEFLAQEVLEALPQDLREFALDCSVLTELNPPLCAALTGRADSAHVLEELYHRNLFLTALDETHLVMRFHDLFREFLLGYLRRSRPECLAQLHARAAQAEPNPIRAIGHRLDAEQWERAAKDIVGSAQGLLMQGASRHLLRLMHRLPRSILDSDPELWVVTALCAWSTADLLEVRHCLRRAATLYRSRQDIVGESRTHLLMLPPLVMLGDLTSAQRALQACEDQLPPDAAERKLLPLGRLWYDAVSGASRNMSRHFADLIDLARSADAGMLFNWLSRVGGGIRGTAVGHPGWEAFFYELEDLVHSSPIAEIDSHPVRSTALVLRVWRLLWTGDLQQAREAVAFAHQVHQRAGTTRGTAIDLRHAEMLLLAAVGDSAGFDSASDSLMELVSTSKGFAEACLPVYTLVRARGLWLLGRDKEMEEATREAFKAEFYNTLGFFEGSLHLARGYCAIARGDLTDAAKELGAASRIQARAPLPAYYGDVEVARAYVHLLAGETPDAATLFSQSLERLDAQGNLGALVVERRDVVEALVQALTPTMRARPVAERVHHLILRAHRPLAHAASHRHEVQLSQRELQVLELVASGASNKIIARRLVLSVHTVKRHLANITSKLGVEGRSQAAASFHGSRLAGP